MKNKTSILDDIHNKKAKMIENNFIIKDKRTKIPDT